ncbi:MAG TPA: hypothetical protein VGI03_04840 [Verrucomicrobiae bacterium]|jgi:uncharacterized membrane protein
MTSQPEDSRKCFGWWLLALFLVALGGQLWVAWLYGSPVPIWDQWDEAYSVFKPWLEGHLTWSQLIAPDNNHRILMTRLLDLGLIQLNGRWDPMLQMTVNAVIHAVFACALAFCLWRLWERKNGWLICFLLMPFFALPYAGENAIWGIDSQWYLLDLFALLTMVGLGFARPGSWRWWLGAASAILGFFTMATGLLAPLAAGGLVLLRVIKRRKMEKENGIGLCVCLLLAGFGAFTIAVAKDNGPTQAMQAHSFAEFTTTLSHFMAWPFPDLTIMACLVALPPALLLIVYLRPNFQELRIAEFLLVLALWSALQSVAIAYGRANADLYLSVASRYMDVCNVFVIASVFAAVLLGGVWESERLPVWGGLLVPLIFFGIIFFGLCRISERVVEDVLVVTREWNLIAGERIQTYMTTGNQKDLFDPPTIQPDPRKALRLLRDPDLPAILPVACFAPANAPAPGRFSALSQWLLSHSIAILMSGLIMFISLCGCGLARGAPAFKSQMPAGTVALLAGLVALGFIWSNRSLQRQAVEYDLQKQITAYFNAVHRPDRAAIHEKKAEKLKLGE